MLDGQKDHLQLQDVDVKGLFFLDHRFEVCPSWNTENVSDPQTAPHDLKDVFVVMEVKVWVYLHSNAD